MKRLEFESLADCCGCGVCAEKCPNKCITLCKDKYGFTIARFNSYAQNQCTDCGLCRLVCPQKTRKTIDNYQPEVIFGQNCDNTVLSRSSSGGFFSLVAKHVLNQKGFVWGVSMNKDGEAHFLCITNPIDLELITGSKYVEVSTPLNYNLVKEQVATNRLVLVSGTPCQILALWNYLGKRKYTNLILIDLLCYGIQSPCFWKLYLSEINKDAKGINKILFRAKNKGWIHYSMHIVFEDGSTYNKSRFYDPWLLTYSTSIMNRESCTSCVSKQFPHISDFTIGDFWGVEYQVEPTSLDIEKGVSIVYINSLLGKKIFDEVSTNFNHIWKGKNGMYPFKASFPMNPQRDSFYKGVICHGFGKTVYKMMPYGLFLWVKKRGPFYKYKTKILVKKNLNKMGLLK